MEILSKQTGPALYLTDRSIAQMGRKEVTINQSGVWAVVVTFHPDLESLARLLHVLQHQVAGVMVVDNGSGKDVEQWLAETVSDEQVVQVICLGTNLGIAAAQNVGIERVKQQRGKYVILFDQDSAPAPDMVGLLLEAVEIQQAQGIRLAAVAPAYSDAAAGNLSGFVRVGLFGFKRVTCMQDVRVVEADFLIASGSLIPVDTLNVVGGMDEGLFIDHVDTEWCFRAKGLGYQLFGVCGARMMHSLGDRRIQIWFLRWRTVPYHSPFRYYYMFRNSVLLQSRRYMPFRWRLADLFRCLRAMVFFGVFSSQRGACLRMMLLGLRHGLLGITGKMP